MLQSTPQLGQGFWAVNGVTNHILATNDLDRFLNGGEFSDCQEVLDRTLGIATTRYIKDQGIMQPDGVIVVPLLTKDSHETQLWVRIALGGLTIVVTDKPAQHRSMADGALGWTGRVGDRCLVV